MEKYGKRGVPELAGKNVYGVLASGLLLAGVLLCVVAFLLFQSVPLTALGFSTIIVGVVSYGVSRGQPMLPPQAIDLLLQSSVENVSALVEEIGLKAKAVYLPSSLTGDKPKALIPIDESVEFSGKAVPNRLIVKFGLKPEAMGLLVITPGSAVKGLVEPKVDCSAGDVESSLSSVLLGTLGLADGVRVAFDEDRVLVEVANPSFKDYKMWIYESLGSPVASISASVVAEVLDLPVKVVSEDFSRGKCLLELKVVRLSI